MKMPPLPPRWATLALLILVPAMLALAACGGDDDGGGGTFEPGNLTAPDRVPTATPWVNAPDVVILDPDNINPLPPDDPNQTEPTPAPDPTGGGEPGVCGDTYTVESGDFLSTIGEKCGVDWQLIAELNPDVDPANLSIGQVLNMPSPNDGESE